MNRQSSTTRLNPYVGPRPFEQGETLYGRAHEVRELGSLLIAERIVMLYSPSGAGKTSLLQAELVPRMAKKRFEVLPIVRMNREPPPDIVINRYVYSLFDYLEEHLPQEKQTPLAELATLSLAEYLERRRVAQQNPRRLVLILDQFEEILTIDPTNQVAKETFFIQVGEALHQRWLWAIFSLREDHIAGLDPFLRPIPTRLKTTFRLELLGQSAAREAIQNPAKDAGVDFTDAAAQKLVDNLRRVQVQEADGTMVEKPGLHVEPVQLQVVCRDLWANLPPGAEEIEVTDIEQVGDVDTALAKYYAQQVKAIAVQTSVSERLIRDWCGQQLVTEGGIRSQVMRGAGASQGLANQAVQALVGVHLVRSEKRRGLTWYELAHDRLVKPVQEDNAAWRETHLSPLQRQAALWAKAGRPDGLLLRDEALTDSEGWAEVHADELEGHEHDFLTTSQAARAVVERELRQTRRIRQFAVGLVVVSLLAIAAAIFAGVKATEAGQQRATAVAALDAVAKAQATQQAAQEQVGAAVAAQATADELRIAAETAGTATTVGQLQTAEAQQAAAAAAQAEADRLRGTAQVASTAAVEQQLTAEVELTMAVQGGVSTEPDSEAPPPTDTPTPGPTATPTSSPTATATSTPTPEPELIAFPPPGEIVFSSNRKSHVDLYSMKADGSDEPVRLTHKWGAEPSYSPATDKIAFSRPTTDESVSLYIMDRNGEGELSVDQRFWDNWEPTFSPDGHRLAFVSSRENLGWEIYSMNIGESDINPRPLICENIPEDWLKWGPAWSPTDEERIAFVVQRGTDLDAERQTDIWVMDDEGANCQQLTEGDASNLGPTWSPDGRQIAFLSDRNGNFEVYIMDRNGRNPHNVTNTPDFDETYVAWSPDGNWLAFTRDIGANDEIFVMTIDGEHVTNITQNSAADWGPVWLP